MPHPMPARSVAARMLLLAVVAGAALSCPPALAETAQPDPGAATPARAAAPLTLDQALALALDRQPEFAAARREIEAADGLLDQAGRLPNPMLSGSVEDLRGGSRTSAFQISQLIELGGKREARRRAAERGQDGARAFVEARALALRAAVAAAFWDALAARRRRQLAEESAALAREALDVVARRVAAGKVSPVDETRARLALGAVEIETRQAAQDSEAARARLAALLALAPAELGEPDGELTLPPAGPAPARLAELVDAAPEARHDAARREAQVDIERSRAVPDVNVGLGLQRNNELGRNQALVGLSIPLPVFDRNQGLLREALARADQGRDLVRATALRVEGEARVAAALLDSARRQAALIDDSLLPDARSARDAATLGFSLGRFGVLDVLDAQRTLFQVRAQQLRALADARRAAAELERLLGTPAF